LLSNFYDDYSYGSDKFKALMDAYEKIFEGFGEMADDAINTMLIPQVSVYKYIPMQLIPLGDSVYDLQSILSDPTIIQTYGMGSMTLAQRLIFWRDQLSVTTKSEILALKGKYILLTTDRIGNPDKKNYEVVDFKASTSSGRELRRNIDYAYEDNRIYLLKLGEGASKESDRIILEDIAIDYKIPEKVIGKNVLTPYSDIVTKNEYRDLVQAMIYVGLGGATVKNLNETLNLLGQSAIGGGTFKVIDYLSAGPSEKDYWKEESRGVNALSRFDFLILAPPDIVYDEGTFTLLKNYLNIIKPSYTSYIISAYIEVLERYRINRLLHTFEKKVTFPHKDLVEASEVRNLVAKITIEKETNHAPKFYDDENLYDDDLLYDTRIAFSEILKNCDSAETKITKSVKGNIRGTAFYSLRKENRASDFLSGSESVITTLLPREELINE